MFTLDAELGMGLKEAICFLSQIHLFPPSLPFLIFSLQKYKRQKGKKFKKKKKRLKSRMTNPVTGQTLSVSQTFEYFYMCDSAIPLQGVSSSKLFIEVS